MSILAMADLAGSRAVQLATRKPDEDHRAEDGGERDGATRSAAPTDYLRRIVEWVPTEAIGGYISAWGITTPTTDASRWILFGVAAAAILFLTLLNAASVSKHLVAKWRRDGSVGTEPGLRISRRALLAGFAFVGFAVWAAALTDSPFATIDDNASRVCAAIAVLVSAVLPKVADWLGLAPIPSEGS